MRPTHQPHPARRMRSLHFPARFIALPTADIGSPQCEAEERGDLLGEDRIAIDDTRILVRGSACKANVTDRRESTADDLMRLLAAKGYEVRSSDSEVVDLDLRGKQLKRVALASAEFGSTDTIVLIIQRNDVNDDDVVSEACLRRHGREVHGCARSTRTDCAPQAADRST